MNKHQQEFIEKSIQKYGDKYGYDRLKYEGISKKVEILCKKCNIYFEQRAQNHLIMNGCTGCKQGKKTKKEYMEMLQSIFPQGRYTFDIPEEVVQSDFIKVTCNRCNKKYEQKLNSTLRGTDCKECKQKETAQKRILKSASQFKDKAIKVHGNLYNYDEIDYAGSQYNIQIFCNKCNDYFWQTPSNHLQGAGCQQCAKKRRSKGNNNDKQQIKKINESDESEDL